MLSISKNNTIHHLLLTILSVVLISFLGYDLWTRGAFVDSVFYGAIAQNLAEDYGGYWTLSATQNPYFGSFYGHPPLGIWLLSFAMQLFDGHFGTERLFSIFNLILLWVGIYKIWSLSRPQHIPKASIWLVVLFWLVMPINIWSYSQYMLENTMAVFIIWAIYWFIKAVQKDSFIAIGVATLFTILATFTKGPVGLFPLICPLIHWFVFRKLSLLKIVTWELCSVLGIILFYSILYSSSTAAAEYMTIYWDKQLMGSLNGSNNLASHRFYILEMLFLEGIVSWASLIFCLLWSKPKIFALSTNGKWVFCFILVTLAGSLPMLVSPKQMKFYLIPALPFLALAAAQMVLPLLQQRLSHIKKHSSSLYYSLIPLLISSFSLSISRYGLATRDSIKIKEVLYLSNILPPNTKGILHSPQVDYIAECYFARYGAIYLNNHSWQPTTAAEEADRTYYLLVEKNYRSPIEPYYIKNDSVSNQLEVWNLFELKK